MFLLLLSPPPLLTHTHTDKHSQTHRSRSRREGHNQENNIINTTIDQKQSVQSRVTLSSNPLTSTQIKFNCFTTRWNGKKCTHCTHKIYGHFTISSLRQWANGEWQMAADRNDVVQCRGYERALLSSRTSSEHHFGWFLVDDNITINHVSSSIYIWVHFCILTVSVGIECQKWQIYRHTITHMPHTQDRQAFVINNHFIVVHMQ